MTSLWTVFLVLFFYVKYQHSVQKATSDTEIQTIFIYIHLLCWDHLLRWTSSEEPFKQLCKRQELKLCDMITHFNDEFFPISSVFSNIFPVFVSYITVLHFMLCLISSEMTWVRKHVLNSFILFPSVILMWCSSHTPFVTAAVFQHAGVI